MGGSSSRILDEVRTSTSDDEIALAKITRCLRGRKSDINYSGKVSACNQHLQGFPIIEHCDSIHGRFLNMLIFLENDAEFCYI